MRHLARLPDLVPKSLRPKRKIKWKKLVYDTLICVGLFVLVTSMITLSYWRGRHDERMFWEPKWEMERDVYRLMPYNEDD